ncbi:dipicolinate synthase subunit B [Pelotomaculum isophthalicicum JI]|uniref:Dipicolinate synthase subunit B n=1 Tax=Pelotomaculum isophthalicicum JI TaxID=947010 RepID=A0A9X4JVD7_9FIRM|nr:dipicolinate synthase subunit B [Pelotomaculum isophthalicicum]MDF9407303.1 dipicolinate synthase subunit B [Pelotomaculum isophthalicicum JI]
MRLHGVKIGFALTGSHCCLDDVIPQVRNLVNEGAEVYPVMSDAVFATDTRFGTSQKWKNMISDITGRDIISTIVGAEPIGPQKLHDIIVVAPCTGNTLAKLANGITDSPVLMAVKAQLRNQRPVVLAVSTNDGLSMNAKNIGLLLNMKNIFLVPFGQDNPTGKPNSLMAKWDLIVDTIQDALKGKQYQPLLVVHN